MATSPRITTRGKLAAVGLSAGLLAGGAAGFAFTGGATLAGAQDATTTTEAPADSGATTPDQQAPHDHLATVLAPLVENGTITQAQADAVIEAISAARPLHGPRDGGGRERLRHGLEAAAKALDMTAAELRTALGDDKSIADVAEEKNVDIDTVIDAMYQSWLEAETAEVAEGVHTQAEVDARAPIVKERITESVDTVHPARGRGDGHRGLGRGGAKDSSGPADAPTTTTK